MFFYVNGFGIRYPTMVDMILKKETKPWNGMSSSCCYLQLFFSLYIHNELSHPFLHACKINSVFFCFKFVPKDDSNTPAFIFPLIPSNSSVSCPPKPVCTNLAFSYFLPAPSLLPRIHRLLLCRRVRLPPQRVSWIWH